MTHIVNFRFLWATLNDLFVMQTAIKVNGKVYVYRLSQVYIN